MWEGWSPPVCQMTLLYFGSEPWIEFCKWKTKRCVGRKEIQQLPVKTGWWGSNEIQSPDAPRYRNSNIFPVTKKRWFTDFIFGWGAGHMWAKILVTKRKCPSEYMKDLSKYQDIYIVFRNIAKKYHNIILRPSPSCNPLVLSSDLYIIIWEHKVNTSVGW